MLEEIAKILQIFENIFQFCLSILPTSPFRSYIDKFVDIPFIGYLNFFVPISDFVLILTTWGTAVAIFYSVSLVLRFVRSIS